MLLFFNVYSLGTDPHLMCTTLFNSHLKKLFVAILCHFCLITQIDSIYLKNGMYLILLFPLYVKHIVGMQ